MERCLGTALAGTVAKLTGASEEDRRECRALGGGRRWPLFWDAGPGRVGRRRLNLLAGVEECCVAAEGVHHTGSACEATHCATSKTDHRLESFLESSS